jgi:hypothetical protein
LWFFCFYLSSWNGRWLQKFNGENIWQVIIDLWLAKILKVTINMSFQFIKSGSFEFLSTLIANLCLINHLLYSHSLWWRRYTWCLRNSIVFETIQVSGTSIERGADNICTTSSPSHFHYMSLYTSEMILKLRVVAAHIPLYVQCLQDSLF